MKSGTIDIQYDDGDYEWYIRTEAYVKAAPSKKSGRSKVLITSDENVLLGGRDAHDLFSKLSNSITKHLNYVPKDGELRYTREHSVIDSHFQGSDTLDSNMVSTMAWIAAEHALLVSIEEADQDLRSSIEANMNNGKYSKRRCEQM